MKHMLIVGAAVVALGLPAGAGQIEAGDVAFEEGAIPMSVSGAAGVVEDGMKVMTNRGLGNCIACHQVTALESFQFHGDVGPTLDGVADRYSEAELRGIVANAKMTFEGTIMPAFYKKSGFNRPGDGYTGKAAKEEDLTTLLTAQQIEDVVAYLLTLKE